ncbi:hypothetical protein GPECTOR_14g73 [Gonium pectorale]|uniref:Uncharacterized protein n=1 Tax=Gonium pectorale TaxID=33097 RepID=A0A150GP41_GONPE|nr:hypothetical protein GPECTOR_14g73 [Gonium pectorale]|eukprot:KXZ51090.1 hypothetical protein GPECTOR_14g73 [Gonium pectorale]
MRALADNYTLEVCPKALWKKLLFLRGPSPQSTFDNVTRWGRSQVQDYARDTVLPQVQANLVFLVIAVVTILGFLMWRLIRRCCLSCCMKESCAEQRAAADPAAVLSGCRFWLLKVFLMVLALAALAATLAGIVMTRKQLVGEVWPPLRALNDHLEATADGMDGLAANLSGVNPILDNLTALANNDVNFAALTTNLQAMKAFLDLPASDPGPLDAALTSLSSAANVSSLAANMGSLATAATNMGTYATRLATLSSELSALIAATGPSFATANLAAALTAVDLATWRPAVEAQAAALSAWAGLQAAVSVPSLAAGLASLDALLTGLRNTQIPATTSSLNSFLAAWNAYSPSLAALIARVDSIQADVVQLDPATTVALQPLRTLQSNLTSLLARSPSPTALASNLTALASELSLGPAASLITAFNTTLAAVPPAALDGARGAVAAVKAALEALQPKKDATAAALGVYGGSASQANFNALKATAAGAGNTAALTTAAQAASSAAASNASLIAVQTAVASGGLVSTAAAINVTLGSASSAAAAVASRLSPGGRVPALGPYTALTATAKATYDSLPATKSAVVDTVLTTVSDLQRQLVSVPDNVRAQVAEAQSSFRSGVSDLRGQVINKVTKFEADRKPTLDKADKYRYQATVAVFAVSAAFAACLLLFVGLNCPWGVAAAVVLQLAAAALLFLLAALFASGLVVAQDGCYHAEHIAVSSLSASSNVKPLLQYYFFAPLNASVQSALQSAGLVDVERVRGQVTGQARAVISNFTTLYSPRWKLQPTLDSAQAFINGTESRIDSILAMAGADRVRPLYEALKAAPCCEAATQGGQSWVLLTFCGWLLMFTSNVAFGFLSRLDQLPQSGCCGCKPLLLSRMRSQVHPDGSPDGFDDGKAVKAVVLSAPGTQAMTAGSVAGGGGRAGGGVEPAADALPSAPPLPQPSGMNPYAFPPYGAYGGGMGPYGAQPPAYAVLPPAPAAQQHYVGAFVGAPMGPGGFGGPPIDPFTGMPMMAPPPPPVAMPPLPPSAAPSQFPDMQPPPHAAPPPGSH